MRIYKIYKMKKILIVFLFFLFIGDISMASPIARTWIYATILIENEWHELGTGFIVFRETENGQGKVFLCTNKHVLNNKKELREKADYIICWLNVKTNEGQIIGKQFTLRLMDPNRLKRWKEHPDKNVDVLVFEITDLIVQNPEIEKKWADYGLFADESILSSQEITIGEEVFIIGYPLAKKQGKTNFPLVRQGIIATQIGQQFIEDSIDDKGKAIQKSYRGFLIDGGAIPGSSGSPVVLKPISGRLVGNSIMMNLPQPYLLGILAETRFAPIKTENGVVSSSYAGLGLVFDASTIKETIELFFNK